jgi:hypothetical protein
VLSVASIGRDESLSQLGPETRERARHVDAERTGGVASHTAAQLDDLAISR